MIIAVAWGIVPVNPAFITAGCQAYDRKVIISAVALHLPCRIQIPIRATGNGKGFCRAIMQVNPTFIASLREAAKEEGQGKNSGEGVALDIKGPAASRRINYLPPPLESKPIVEGECLIKFWIFPDGTVGKAIPLAQGDTQAVVAAIDRVKKFRFAPLPKDVPQVEQWGIIPAQSVLR